MTDTSSPLSSEDNARREAQREILQASMKKSLEGKAHWSRVGEFLLEHLDTFLISSGVETSRVTRARDYLPLRGSEGPFLSHLQQLSTQWALSLPLDTTVEHKRGEWSLPAVLVRELFNGLMPSSLMSDEGRSVGVWLTLLLNGLWQAATPELKKTWRADAGSPSCEGKRSMTRAWIFWGARFQACMAQQHKDFPVLLLPPDLTSPDTEDALLLHTYRDTKADQMAALQNEIWLQDSTLHPAFWNAPSLFTAHKFETFWVPHLSSEDFDLPLTLKPPLTQAICQLLETQPDSFTAHTVKVVCFFLFDTFPLTMSTPTSERDLESLSTLERHLLKGIETWIAGRTAAHTSSGCDVPLGTSENAARFNRFWDQCFLKHALTAQSEQEKGITGTLRVRRRV